MGLSKDAMVLAARVVCTQATVRLVASDSIAAYDKIKCCSVNDTFGTR